MSAARPQGPGLSLLKARDNLSNAIHVSVSPRELPGVCAPCSLWGPVPAIKSRMCKIEVENICITEE